ncbi:MULTISPECIES: helix-turn-helix domain-containing protein [unclassified Streptomyces]|uniref:helix-turn-helix domain-containing protein n=1 Tax=unclassified Streptomyces TaxID=2593676 RepID=UPI002023F75F|nr:MULTISPECIES: helix-turn-helix domain-containing protein [unclassified Streptomyces]MCX4550533.1 helix-turn-helix domain-containing protein [Streptomyces sp. NBC_01500]WSC21980.1 helix-turn-helix domain-containing protein [Streptomyces sp. NBC_01766]
MSVSLQNYTLEEAAELLRCKPRFLEDNLRDLPHQKIGAAVAFDAEEVLAIKAMHRVRPEPTPAAEGARTLMSISPSRSRQRTG